MDHNKENAEALSEQSNNDANDIESPTTQQQPQTKDDCPNGGYGWVCVACCFLINAHTWGLNSAYGVFLAYYLDNNIFPGGTALRYAFVGGLSVSQALMVAPVATIVVRKYGTRFCCAIGIGFETASFIGASFATEIWQLFLSQGVCFGWGMGFLFISSVSVPPQWFTTKRSYANACSAAGSGLGGLVYSLAANAAIQNLGLPWTFRLLGIIAFVVNTTCTILLKDRNRQIGSSQRAFDHRLFKTPQFNLLQAWGFFSMLGYIVLLFSLPNYARDIGLTHSQGAVVSAILQLGQMIGRPPVGFLSDAFGRINMSSAMTFLCALFSLVIWTNATNYGVLLLFALLSGTVAGTFWATVGPLGAEVCGLEQLPSVLSITWLFIVLPTTFSEAIALEIVHKTSTGYLGAQLFAGFMYLAAAICLWGVRIWKVGELEGSAIEKAEKTGGELPQRSSWLHRAIALKKV